MIDRLSETFNFRQQALQLREERQKVLAANIANADTPQYKARDIDFRTELSRALSDGRASSKGINLSTTSEKHIPIQNNKRSADVNELLYRVPIQPSLDGNTVDMERERAYFADNSVRYQASLTFMKSYIQGLKGAMQPE